MVRDFNDLQYHYQFDHKSVLTSSFLWRVNARSTSGSIVWQPDVDLGSFALKRTACFEKLNFQRDGGRVGGHCITVATFGYMFFSARKFLTTPDCVPSVS